MKISEIKRIEIRRWVGALARSAYSQLQNKCYRVWTNKIGLDITGNYDGAECWVCFNDAFIDFRTELTARRSLDLFNNEDAIIEFRLPKSPLEMAAILEFSR